MPRLRAVRSVMVSHDAKEAQLVREEEERVEDVLTRRRYYLGQQYDKMNEDVMSSLQVKTLAEVPEHKKKHAYSTQIGECVDFLADRLGEGFTITAHDSRVQDVIDQMVAATDTIAAETEDGDLEIVTDDLLREAFQAGDVAAYVGWDPIEGRAFLEFWESEYVEFRTETIRRVDKVIRTEVVWRTVDNGDLREVTERVEYELVPNEAGRLEARAATYWDDDEDPRDIEWLGLGRLPWALLRADQKKIRTFRGESLVTPQVMAAADRYNAVEQISFLIARYNSHGNLAVIGDGASLKAESDGRVSKDVADVLTFPGGTALQEITLPTDPQMIEHQRKVLAESMYNVFGLTRMEPDTLEGLGSVSGYALEILNQKSAVTFKRIARRWRKDFTSLLSLVLDVYAWKSEAQVGVVNPETGVFTATSEDDLLLAVDPATDGIPTAAWWDVDPDQVFPDRKVEIRMGSGYIVDDTLIRDDFVANLISRAEALRKRGYDDTDIDTIQGEIEAEAPPEPETGLAGPPRKTIPGAASRNGTKAGSTVGSTTRA